MHSPEIAEENEILSALRLGRKEISHGIEKEIDELHKLSPVKRGLEFATLFLLYGTGVFPAHLSRGNPSPVRMRDRMHGLSLQYAGYPDSRRLARPACEAFLA